MRIKGLEPPRLSASDPKSDVATNYTISAALAVANIQLNFDFANFGRRESSGLSRKPPNSAIDFFYFSDASSCKVLSFAKNKPTFVVPWKT